MPTEQRKLALLSVSDKTNLISFARQLRSIGFDLVAGGGDTAQVIRDAGLTVQEPHSNHACIRMVVCNFDIGNIDIGGVALLRAAAKNYARVTVLCDPHDYTKILEEIQMHGDTTEQTRKSLAHKACSHADQYEKYVSSAGAAVALPSNRNEVKSCRTHDSATAKIQANVEPINIEIVPSIETMIGSKFGRVSSYTPELYEPLRLRGGADNEPSGSSEQPKMCYRSKHHSRSTVHDPSTSRQQSEEHVQRKGQKLASDYNVLHKGEEGQVIRHEKTPISHITLHHLIRNVQNPAQFAYEIFKELPSVQERLYQRNPPMGDLFVYDMCTLIKTVEQADKTDDLFDIDEEKKGKKRGGKKNANKAQSQRNRENAEVEKIKKAKDELIGKFIISQFVRLEAARKIDPDTIEHAKTVHVIQNHPMFRNMYLNRDTLIENLKLKSMPLIKGSYHPQKEPPYRGVNPTDFHLFDLSKKNRFRVLGSAYNTYYKTKKPLEKGKKCTIRHLWQLLIDFGDKPDKFAEHLCPQFEGFKGKLREKGLMEYDDVLCCVKCLCTLELSNQKHLLDGIIMKLTITNVINYQLIGLMANNKMKRELLETCMCCDAISGLSFFENMFMKLNEISNKNLPQHRTRPLMQFIQSGEAAAQREAAVQNAIESQETVTEEIVLKLQEEPAIEPIQIERNSDVNRKLAKSD